MKSLILKNMVLLKNDKLSNNYALYLNIVVPYFDNIWKEGSGVFTASQNNKIGKIVDNFYIQLNTS